MTINYGKRYAGDLTASSPGDTLYIPLQFFNDSGASISIAATLSVTDIEVFRNGSTTQRATDSGYAILGDTGNFDNRIGFKGISIQLFNTADDPSFYAAGSMYWVAIDSVAVDSRTVRFFPAVFEIGTERANVTQIAGDTGASGWLKAAFASGFTDTGLNERLARIQSDVDTGLRVHIDDLDTGIHSILQTVGVLVSAFSDTGVNERLARIQSDVDTGLRLHIDDSDTGIKDTIADLDTGLRGILNTTGVNVTKIVGDTGPANNLKKTLDSTPTYFPQVNAVQLGSDTGALNWLKQTFAAGFSDTGIQERLARIQSDVDTGIRVHIDDSDTGIKDTISDLDTGLRGILNTTGVNVTKLVGDTGAANWLKQTFAVGFNDTGINERFARIQSDVDTGIRVHIDDSDTGLKDTISDLDTGLRGILNTTGVNVTKLVGDTGAANWLKQTFENGFSDTGVQERFGRIQSDVDTGLRVHIDDSDTGVKDAIADLDTGLRDYIDNTDTGLRKYIDNLDTGIKNRFDDLAEDTGGVNINAIAGDTGAASRLQQFAGTKLSSLGMVDTGTLAGTRAGTIDANIVSVNETSVQGDGSPGNEWRP